MKNLKSKIIVSIVMAVITLVTLCATITLAWFSTTASDNYKMIIKANSMLVLKFDPGISVSPDSGKLIPAIETVDAIRNNVDFSKIDLTQANENLTRTANVITYDSTLYVYLGTKETESQEIAIPQDIVFGISMTIRTKDGYTFDCNLTEMQEIVKFKFYIQTTPLVENGEDENVTYQPDPDEFEEVVLSQAYRQEADSVLFLRLDVSLAQPQGLLDPTLLGSDLWINLNVSAKDANLG